MNNVSNSTMATFLFFFVVFTLTLASPTSSSVSDIKYCWLVNGDANVPDGLFFTQMGAEKRKIACSGKSNYKLKGMGSSPPRCVSKCGKCTPCKPVLVVSPPPNYSPNGAPEYKPEAWMCECHNKYYRP